MSGATKSFRLMKKVFAKGVKADISRILWERWDPLGVNDTTAARNEYDNYVECIFVLLTQNADEDKIAARLRQIETVNMGLRGSSEAHLKQVIAALRQIDFDTDAP